MEIDDDRVQAPFCRERGDLIKKIKIIIIIALVIWGMVVFYKKFMAPTLGPFFKEKTRNVDFFGFSFRDYNKELKK